MATVAFKEHTLGPTASDWQAEDLGEGASTVAPASGAGSGPPKLTSTPLAMAPRSVWRWLIWAIVWLSIGACAGSMLTNRQLIDRATPPLGSWEAQGPQPTCAVPDAHDNAQRIAPRSSGCGACIQCCTWAFY